MDKTQDTPDPRGLIRESYRIVGITIEECRSIFLDWTISVPLGEDSTAQVRRLIEIYAKDDPDHPMTQVLRQALAPAARTGRRGGASARRKG